MNRKKTNIKLRKEINKLKRFCSAYQKNQSIKRFLDFKQDFIIKKKNGSKFSNWINRWTRFRCQTSPKQANTIF